MINMIFYSTLSKKKTIMKIYSILIPLICGFFLSCNGGGDSGNQSSEQSDQLPVYEPEVYSIFDHDPDAYTQGLFYFDGSLYENTGLYGESTLRKVAIDGEVLQKIDLDSEYFGEGITLYEDKIIQLTWKSKIGFVYDRETFQLLDEFNYTTEGWGITYDGEYLDGQ